MEMVKLNIGIMVGAIYLGAGLCIGILNAWRSREETLVKRIVLVPMFMVGWIFFVR